MNTYQNEIGFVTSKTNKFTNELNILYDGSKTDMDILPGRWYVLCSYHGLLVPTKTKKNALYMLKNSIEWCENCAKLADIEEAEYIMTLHCERENNEQLKLLANLAIGNPAKSQLFENLTGLQPENFLPGK